MSRHRTLIDRPRTYEQLTEAIRQRGYRIKPGDHHRVLRPNGTLLMTLASSPSDRRGAMNAWNDFRQRVQAERRGEDG